MKIHEYQAVDLFKKAGLPVLEGQVAATLEEALKIADRIGYPVVLKSQVLVGGRGKAGGIKVVKTRDDLAKLFPQLRSLVIKGYPVEKILIVRAIDIKKEFYAAVTVDPVRGDVVLIASSEGGVDIEETAKTHPEKIQKYYLEGQKRIDPARWPAFIKAVFADKGSQEQGTKIFEGILKVFFQYDCSLAEVNPLVIDAKGDWYAADAKINFDDNGLFRHEELVALRDMRYEDPDEIEAKDHNLSFVKMDGNVGCVVNGAGLAMATMDVTKILGGDPANFLDVGGSSNPEKVLSAMKIILRNPKIKAILINIFGGITRCDDIANGIIAARQQLKISVPLVVRLAGTNEKEARDILEPTAIHAYSSMREAVQQAVALAK
ncbi:MAG: ADP-forming succinate--CoA ligase subunit beta [Candidatus Omnitrophota bacterium]|nr:ADP-forming succinate--CoA ligase subunit beta [Candidatus Omnitrophota bacterium]MDZ4241430.1 ADP-forming succinate--CoA ligase subunit beta [Candidatus Omnitrophota bacterium]